MSIRQTISLSDHFTTQRLLRYTLPTIVMMVFTSVYTVVDGLFVSNLAGKTSFAALNFIYPVIAIISSVGFMTGTGGSALVAKILGQGERQKAQRIFSLIVYFTLALGALLGLILFLSIEPIARFMGAEGLFLDEALTYGRILALSLPAFILQMMFQSFMVAADRPSLGLIFSLLSGGLNIILDYLFIAVFGWGLAGAAWATAISQVVGGVVPILYFALPNSSLLRLGSTRWSGADICKTCINGSSEMATQISMSFVVMLYNTQLLRYIGENGVAAFGVIGYIQFVFISIFLGYSIGSAPIVSYNYGAEQHEELRGVVRRSLKIVALFAIGLTLTAELLSTPLSRLFVGYDEELFALTRKALSIYAISFLLQGFSIYFSSMFTALNNGVVSAIISFSRTLIFECGAVLIIPSLVGIDGIWWSVSVAEVAALILCAFFFVRLRNRYHY